MPTFLNSKKCTSFFSWIVLIIIMSIGNAQTERWVFTYSGPGDYTDEAKSIVYGGDGNIYAAGYSVGANANKDFTVISLTAAGDSNWVYTYNGPTNGDDEARYIIYADGNIYAAGYSGSSIDADILVISFTIAGDTNWTYRYDGPMQVYDEAYQIVYGLDGNLYVAGYTVGLGTGQDFSVISLTPAGNQRWVYSPGFGYPDYAYSLVYGADDNIYAAGTSVGLSSPYDFAVISVDTAGDQRWIYRYNGTANDWDCAYSIAYGLDNNIYAAGYSKNSGTYEDFTVISLDTAGNERWVNSYNGTGTAGDFAYSIVCASDSKIYAAGRTAESGAGWGDFTVTSYTTAGDTNWLYSYNDTINGFDCASQVVYGGDGNLYAAGRSTHAINSASDFIVNSISPLGSERWVYSYDGPGFSRDSAACLVYGGDGNIYAAGKVRVAGTNSDFAVISINPSVSIQENQPGQASQINFVLLSSFFRESIAIRFTNATSDPLKICIYDIAGRLVYENSFSSTPSYLCLNDNKVARLPQGVYFLSISQNKNVQFATKIIKLR